jgi:RimJ/RimL family protein N-acetyltransferase
VTAQPRPTFRQLRAAHAAARQVRRWPAPGPTADDRFALRLLRADDRGPYLASIDHEVRHYQGYDARFLADHAAAFDRLARARGATQQRLVVELQGGYAGSYSIMPSTHPGADVEVGWWLAPQTRTKGIGQASLRAVLDHVHRGIGAPVARMGTTHDNVRAIRQIEAVAAVRVGETDHTLPDGRTVKGWWYHHMID